MDRISKIKELLKKSYFIRNIYFKANKNFVAFLIKNTPVLASKYLYRRGTGKKLNLKNPQDFNDKLQWLKLYWQHPLVAKCADKYEVREYVKRCGCEEVLNELYGVYETTSEIDWDSLPSKFALKCTHGCGFDIICDDKSKLDKNEALEKLNEWLKIDFSLYAAELHYAKMKPRIICEKYIETNAGFLPIDYKVYCFNGKPKWVLVCTDRTIGYYKRACMDLNWKKLDIVLKGVPTSYLPNKPNCFNSMLEYAEKLATPFPFVRVDFYDYNGMPILGEMTFTPLGCMANYDEYSLKKLGDMLDLPEKYIEK